MLDPLKYVVTFVSVHKLLFSIDIEMDVLGILARVITPFAAAVTAATSSENFLVRKITA